MMFRGPLVGAALAILATTAGVTRAEPGGGHSALSRTGQRAQALREAADLLDKAHCALARGNRDLAEMLFSSAELLVGPDALATLAPIYRRGAPPRLNTPLVKANPDEKSQPMVEGSSDAEDEAAHKPRPRVVASLTGTVDIGGKPLHGTYGLVTLQPAHRRWTPRRPKRRVMEQRGREFRPHVLAVPVGSTVSFPNFDPYYHNVFSTSPLGAFDLGLYKSGEQRSYTFHHQGIIRLGCNLHANMSAYIVVVAAPSYDVTDGSGHFAFRRLRPGRYKLKAWSERSKAPVTRTITIHRGKNTITVGVPADAPTGPSPDKFGEARG